MYYYRYKYNFKANIILNSQIPLNAKKLVEYAHENGIRVIWGFSWGWLPNCNEVDITKIDSISRNVIETYERDYSHLNGDGIYFQSFTETEKEEIKNIK